MLVVFFQVWLPSPVQISVLSMATTIYYNCQLFTGDQVLSGAWFTVEQGRIQSIGTVDNLPSGAQLVDLGGMSVAPALMDLQIYGGGGKLFNNEPSAESIHATWEEVRAGGAAHFQITLSSSPLNTIREAIDACREYWAQGGNGLLGLHLEGPYFNPEKRGAHPLEFIRTPTRTELLELLEYGEGVLNYLTLAPEMISTEDLDFLLSSGVHLSAGHSNATYQQGMAGFRRGIGRATHFYNAMSPLQGRSPGMVGAILDARPFTSIIVDGVHCDFAAVRIAKRILQEKLFLITDAVTECRTGRYQFQFKEDRYVDADGTLSGSSLNMWKAVQNTVREVGIPLDEALRMASVYPAEAIGRAAQTGKLAPGYPAQWILFDDQLELLQLHGF